MCRVRLEFAPFSRALHAALDRFPDRFHMEEQYTTTPGLVDGALPIDGTGGVDLTYGVWIGVSRFGD